GVVRGDDLARLASHAHLRVQLADHRGGRRGDDRRRGEEPRVHPVSRAPPVTDPPGARERAGAPGPRPDRGPRARAGWPGRGPGDRDPADTGVDLCYLRPAVWHLVVVYLAFVLTGVVFLLRARETTLLRGERVFRLTAAFVLIALGVFAIRPV